MESNTLLKNPYTLSEEEQTSLQEYKQYDTRWDRGTLQARKDLYAKMPNVERLEIHVRGFVNQVFYLRPTIKSISMEFHLSFQEQRRGYELELLHPEAFLDWFQELKSWIVNCPEGQLEELHIKLAPQVQLYFSLENYYTVEYDEDGPIYEDEDWFVHTSKHNPSDYFFMLTQKSRKELEKVGNSLLELLSLKQWKAITLPSAFPSAKLVAEKYPFTKLTDEVKQEGLYERITASSDKFHRHHIQELKGTK